ncbi:MAG TPA: YdcF family protein [Casimicrobiaceae bacterium]|nr:YdcF family protein [Casimicrobiaceae bacterium]
MIDPIWIKAVLKTLVLPPTGPLLVALAGLALLHRRFHLATRLAWIGVLSLAVLSMPAVAVLLLQLLKPPAPFDRAEAGDAHAIVILGGGIRHDAPEYGGDTLNALTLERVRYGARLARETGLPLLVTGGSTYGGTPEAHLMREALQREFGLSARWAEDRSRTTHESARNSAALLRAAGIGRVVLVAHAFDMRRARAEFAAAGIATVPAATGLPSRGPPRLIDYLPGIGGLEGSYYALYEILANLVRFVTTSS